MVCDDCDGRIGKDSLDELDLGLERRQLRWWHRLRDELADSRESQTGRHRDFLRKRQGIRE